MRILLINAPEVNLRRQSTPTTGTLRLSPPLPIGFLAAILERDGHEVQLLDMNVAGDEVESFEKLLEDLRPALVGISAMTASFPAAARFARLSKEILPRSPVVVGGCHVTFTAAQTLEENPAIDFVVRGEGERTLQELTACVVAGQPLQHVLGLSYRQDGHIVHNPPRPFIQDLDALPWPARHLMDLPAYNTPGALISSRGCPGRCIFCVGRAMGGPRYRHRQPERVVDEMEHLHHEYGLQWLAILDDTFTGSPQRFTLPVCNEIRRRGLKVGFGCESRVDVATPQLIETLYESGCDLLHFGVESGSSRVLAALGKRITLEQVRQAVKCATGLGMDVACSFVLGHPNETQEDAYMTLNFMQELLDMGISRAVISPLIPFPGTDVYERREFHGVTVHTNDWSQFGFGTPIISTRHLSRDLLREFYVEASVRIVQHFRAVAVSQGNKP